MRLDTCFLFFLSSMGVLSEVSTRGDEASPPSNPSQVKRERQMFAGKLAQVRVKDTKEDVGRLLGIPEDIRRATNALAFADAEIWCYGADQHDFLPTLGEVCFRQGKVFWVAGGKGVPPLPTVISESELRAGMQFMHPGPEYPGYNDPLHLIRVTNYLQPLGKEKALAIIGEYGRIHEPGLDETWLFLLLRTLFDVPQPPGYMPDMDIGGMDPPAPKDRRQIPRFPIVIVDDVPFSLLQGVMLCGQAEPVSRHVEYFRKFGTIRTARLRPPDDPYPSFQRLINSKEWAEMAKADDNSRWGSAYAERALLQVLAIGRTAYDPPEARQPVAYPSTSDYDRHHKALLETGARWDEKLQMYVRRDGTHGHVGHLANIYNREGKAKRESTGRKTPVKTGME